MEFIWIGLIKENYTIHIYNTIKLDGYTDFKKMKKNSIKKI